MVAEAKPRSIVSIVLIGLFLGPVSVMLWLGRGKIAILYLVAQVAWAGFDNQTDYIMRIVGLPGERIQMIAGVVHINGVAVEKERAGSYDNSDPFSPPELDKIPMYRETMPNGLSYMVLDAEPNGPADNTPEYVVPDGHYFMMGDNRDSSLDSRYERMGYVPYENLIGPAVLIFWNSRGVRIDGRLSGHPASE